MTMPTTTLRLPDELKRRIAMAAERKGTSPHAFMLNTLAERVSEDERRDDFHATAERRYAEIVASGRTIPWSEMRTWLEDRFASGATPRPTAGKPRP